MSSFWVITETGERYGPADLATLQAWVNEGRILASTQIYEEPSQLMCPAGEIPGLQFRAIEYQGAFVSNLPMNLSHRLNTFPVWAVVLLTIFVPLFTTIWLGLMHDALPRVRRDDPSAGKAIGFSLIPFFNIWYWNFFNYPRLLLRVNEQRAAAGLPIASLNGLVTAMCILYACFIPLACLPLISLLFILSLTAVRCVFAATLQQAVNELVDVSQQRGFAAVVREPA